MSQDNAKHVKLPDEGGQAFPCPTVLEGPNDCVRETGDTGMTIRQWLAGHALQGLVGGIHICKAFEERDFDAIAFLAYRLADAMIAHENKEVDRWREDRRKITPPEDTPAG